jgi:flagellum-specific peptidoglycan hydrolase FlgJ
MNFLKKCYKCQESKPVADFYKNKSKHDGLTSECKICNKIANKRWQVNNYEKELKRKKELYWKDVETARTKSKNWRTANKERKKEMDKVYRQANQEKIKINKAKWRAANRETYNARKREYNKKNRAMRNADWYRYQMQKTKAAPSWLTTEQYNKIKQIYKQAKNLEKQTGVKHHVDHIIPLRGKHVCGLHVPENLQVLPASINISKGNKHE